MVSVTYHAFADGSGREISETTCVASCTTRAGISSTSSPTTRTASVSCRHGPIPYSHGAAEGGCSTRVGGYDSALVNDHLHLSTCVRMKERAATNTVDDTRSPAFPEKSK